MGLLSLGSKHKQAVYIVACLYAMAYLAPSLHHEQTLFAPQRGLLL